MSINISALHRLCAMKQWMSRICIIFQFKRWSIGSRVILRSSNQICKCQQVPPNTFKSKYIILHSDHTCYNGPYFYVYQFILKNYSIPWQIIQLWYTEPISAIFTDPLYNHDEINNSLWTSWTKIKTAFLNTIIIKSYATMPYYETDFRKLTESWSGLKIRQK